MSAPRESNKRADLSAKPSRIRWLVLAMACGASFCLYLHRFTWTFIVPELQQNHGWSELQTQAAYLCFSSTYGLGQIPSGILIDRYGPRLFLTLIIAAWSLVIPWQASSHWLMVGGSRLAIGATQAGCYPGLALVTARWFPVRYRTIIQALVATVCGRGGGALAPIVMATFLMAYLGLSVATTLWVMTTVGLLFAGAFWLLTRDTPEDDPRVNLGELQLIHDGATPLVSAATGGAAERLPIAQALRLRSVWMLALMQAFVAGVDTIYSSMLGQYFNSRGVSLGKAGLLASIPLFGGMLGGLTAALVNDGLMRLFPSRSHARRAIGLGANLCACLAMLAMVRQTDALWAALALGVVKYFADMSQPIGWGTCTDIGGRRGSATVFSIMNAGGNFGSFVLPMLFGVIATRSERIVEDQVVKNYVPVFTVAAGIYIAAGLMWLLIDSSRSLDDVASEEPAADRSSAGSLPTDAE
jgi:ACS family D-galactonate transporter-like MFS transporter